MKAYELDDSGQFCWAITTSGEAVHRSAFDAELHGPLLCASCKKAVELDDELYYTHFKATTCIGADEEFDTNRTLRPDAVPDWELILEDEFTYWEEYSELERQIFRYTLAASVKAMESGESPAIPLCLGFGALLLSHLPVIPDPNARPLPRLWNKKTSLAELSKKYHRV